MLNSTVSLLRDAGVSITGFCIANVGAEAFPYLLHIAKFYDDLSDWVVFLHDHGVPKENRPLNDCVVQYYFSKLERHPFVSFSNNFPKKPESGRTTCPIQVPNNPYHMDQQAHPFCPTPANSCFRANLCTDDGRSTPIRGVYNGQMVVAKHLILKRPRNVSATAASCFDACYTETTKPAGARDNRWIPGRTSAVHWEQLWHVFFGMDRNLPDELVMPEKDPAIRKWVVDSKCGLDLEDPRHSNPALWAKYLENREFNLNTQLGL